MGKKQIEADVAYRYWCNVLRCALIDVLHPDEEPSGTGIEVIPREHHRGRYVLDVYLHGEEVATKLDPGGSGYFPAFAVMQHVAAHLDPHLGERLARDFARSRSPLMQMCDEEEA